VVSSWKLSFIIRDANGQALSYVYYENEPGRRTAVGLLTPDEANVVWLRIGHRESLAKRA
jgi:hypothetical protein